MDVVGKGFLMRIIVVAIEPQTIITAQLFDE